MLPAAGVREKLTSSGRFTALNKSLLWLTLELRRCRFRHQHFFILLYLQIFALQGVNFF